MGIDLAGPEEDDYVPKLAQTYQLFIDGQNVQLTLHAGECGCIRNVYQAIESGAKRIGHGIILKGIKKPKNLSPAIKSVLKVVLLVMCIPKPLRIIINILSGNG